MLKVYDVNAAGFKGQAASGCGPCKKYSCQTDKREDQERGACESKIGIKPTISW